MMVPIDDANTMFYFIAWTKRTKGIDQEAWRKFCAPRSASTSTRTYRKTRNRGTISCRTARR